MYTSKYLQYYYRLQAEKAMLGNLFTGEYINRNNDD